MHTHTYTRNILLLFFFVSSPLLELLKIKLVPEVNFLGIYGAGLLLAGYP